MQCTFQKLISVEPGTLTDDEPVVILSLGDVDGPVHDFALVCDCARDLVVQTLQSLAAHGDETASEILEQYFVVEDES